MGSVAEGGVNGGGGTYGSVYNTVIMRHREGVTDRREEISPAIGETDDGHKEAHNPSQGIAKSPADEIGDTVRRSPLSLLRGPIHQPRQFPESSDGGWPNGSDDPLEVDLEHLGVRW